MHSAVPRSTNMDSHTVSSGDLEVLSLLTSDESTMGPLPTRPKAHNAKRLPRRESPMDALLISAVLSGSGPLTRHHIGHGAGKSLRRLEAPQFAHLQPGPVRMLHVTNLDLHHLHARAILPKSQ